MSDTIAKLEHQLQILQAELRQREYEIDLLRETATAVGSELNLDKVLQLIAERARELIDAETLLIPILNRECDEYTYRAGAGRGVEEIVGESLPLDFGVCGWVWEHKRPWWRGMLDELSEAEKNRWEKEAGTLIMVPLIGREHFLGGIAGINKRGGEEFSRQDLNLLSLFASQVAIAIENAMAVHRLDQAREEAETYQNELQQLNSRLQATNQELEFLSLYDPLTALPNRSLLRDRIQQGLAAAQRDGGGLAVLVIDLDRFKEINDALGHEVGDQLLKQVSNRFAAELRHSDTIGRLGGDEFAVVLAPAETQAVTRVANALLEALATPFIIGSHRLAVTASIGIALYPEHGEDAGTLFQHADAAMYAAKRDRCSVGFYNSEVEENSLGRLTLVSDLRHALNESEFELYYQPKLDLASNNIIGVEALARWPHRKRGLVMPDSFIPALEQTGLIQQFNFWVLDAALEQCAAWQARGWSLGVAVNLPVTSLLDPNFVGELAQRLERWELWDKLTLEITENLFLSDYDRLTEVFGQLRDLGVNFSIDDFGTGHSSLSRLRQLPVSELKIDRSFVMGMAQNADDATIVRSTIDLAHNLGHAVVAEGVENDSILQQLKQLDCDIIQGYHISRPLPVAEFEAFVEDAAWPIARPQEQHLGFLKPG
ncbi:EAL domain-containing protein [Thiohalobacter sp. IOR34]|uniref:putative bifunctional diguanylate cyclase/phosphodiesterase n=1 Tax=Thiohalobacter sp. IOR34 TaxID=3057176 RepID=UPI0025B21B9F|nr:EAL domain-containing protein [Thiohalobacter sp. IOR34]WJW76741.1 EAL domain-containing protein [Thiohalobacter sp. IOR34]